MLIVMFSLYYRFAIYIPLFLPIGIPMLINIVKRLKRLTRTPDNKPKAD